MNKNNLYLWNIYSNLINKKSPLTSLSELMVDTMASAEDPNNSLPQLTVNVCEFQITKDFQDQWLDKTGNLDLYANDASGLSQTY